MDPRWLDMVMTKREAILAHFDTDDFDAAALQLLRTMAPEQMAESLLTPEGRAWLMDRTGSGENAILRLAFALEWLYGAGVLDLPVSVAEAMAWTNQGLTLRDMLRDITFGHTEAWAPHGEAADRAQVEVLLAHLPVRYYDLLVVSDLHLAAGNHPTPEGLVNFSPTEDFFFDDTFFRFLYHIEMERKHRRGYPYELVINGDGLDFVQVVDQDMHHFDLVDLLLPECLWEAFYTVEGEEPGPVQRVRGILNALYGDEPEWQRFRTLLDAQPPRERHRVIAETLRAELEQNVQAPQKAGGDLRREALGQLADICTGHPLFFQGLAWFLAQGNRLVIIRGNHDPHWYWPEVQIAFVGWLVQAYADLRQRCHQKEDSFELPVPVAELETTLPELDFSALESRIDFDHSWFYYRSRLVYLEHGGQLEPVNAHRYFLMPVYDSLAPPAGNGRSGSVPPKRTQDWLPILEPTLHETEIHPQIGSLGLVHLVNDLEISLPNFESPAYRRTYLNWLLFHEPWRSLPMFGRALWDLRRAWAAWFRHPVSGAVEERHAAKLRAYARLTGLPWECVRDLDETRWVKTLRASRSGTIFVAIQVALALLPFAIFILGVVFAGQVTFLQLGPYPESRPILLNTLLSVIQTVIIAGAAYWITMGVRTLLDIGEDYTYKSAHRIARLLKRYGHDVPYYIFGHDHAHNAQLLTVRKLCSQCGTGLRKRNVRLREGKIEVRQVTCSNPACDARGDECVDAQALQKLLVKQPGAGWRPNHGSANRLPSITAVATPAAFGIEQILCKRCNEPLEESELERIEVHAAHALFTCPKCGTKETQLLGWSLRCPRCHRDKPPRRRWRLVEEGLVMRCECGHGYPDLAPVRRWYLNAGTWLSNYTRDRKRLLRDEQEYAFIRMQNTQRVLAVDRQSSASSEASSPLHVELLRWDDAVKCVRPCRIFTDCQVP